MPEGQFELGSLKGKESILAYATLDYKGMGKGLKQELKALDAIMIHNLYFFIIPKCFKGSQRVLPTLPRCFLLAVLLLDQTQMLHQL